jgi:hypothetical protein
MLRCPRAELKREIKRYRDEGILGTSETTKRVVEFIRKPPLSKTALLAYDRMFDGAVASIPPEFQEMLGLKGKSLKIAGPITRGILNFTSYGSRSGFTDGRSSYRSLDPYR